MSNTATTALNNIDYSKSSNFKLCLFIFSGWMGIFWEILDFALYAYASSILAKVFLPDSEYSKTFIWLIFICGFLVRVFGSLCLGRIGDKFGAKKALTISSLMMASATIGIGILPGYAQIGILAPIGLLVLRCIQGFAVSPEYSSISVYLSGRKAIKKYYSFLCSTSDAMASLALLTSGYLVSLVADQVDSVHGLNNDWRLIFIGSGLILGIVTILLRVSMDDKKSHSKRHTPIKDIFKNEKHVLFVATLVAGFMGFMAYSLGGFISNFLHDNRGFDYSVAIELTSRNAYLMTLCGLMSGMIADFVGRRRMLVFTYFSLMILSPIVYYYIFYGEFAEVRYAIMVLSAFIGLNGGLVPSYITSYFSQGNKFSGSAFAYNLGVFLFGSTSPWFLTTVANIHPMYPALTICLFAVILLLAIWSLKYKKEQYGYNQT